MDQEFGMKELDQVILKATSNIEIGGIKYAPGEVVVAFDKISIMTLQGKNNTAQATGGYDNRARVTWDELTGATLLFYQGVFSKKQLSFFTNSFIEENVNDLTITEEEEIESDENGEVTLKFSPIKDTIFIYDKETKEKIYDFTLEENVLSGLPHYTDLIIRYEFIYPSSIRLVIGSTLLPGFLSLEGRARVKEDLTGRIVTQIIKIPRLKLMSNLSIRMGNNATPVVGEFYASAEPVGQRANKKIIEIFFLEENIDKN